MHVFHAAMSIQFCDTGPKYKLPIDSFGLNRLLQKRGLKIKIFAQPVCKYNGFGPAQPNHGHQIWSPRGKQHSALHWLKPILWLVHKKCPYYTWQLSSCIVALYFGFSSQENESQCCPGHRACKSYLTSHKIFGIAEAVWAFSCQIRFGLTSFDAVGNRESIYSYGVFSRYRLIPTCQFRKSPDSCKTVLENQLIPMICWKNIPPFIKSQSI